jgi:hypothetical protein
MSNIDNSHGLARRRPDHPQDSANVLAAVREAPPAPGGGHPQPRRAPRKQGRARRSGGGPHWNSDGGLRAFRPVGGREGHHPAGGNERDLAWVVEAGKSARANVIHIREETSATRSLLETAMMGENSVALRLKDCDEPQGKPVLLLTRDVSLERATADAQTIRAAARQCLKRVSIVSSVFSVCGRQNFSVRLWNITTGRGRVCAMKRATGPAVFRSSISSEDP